MVDKRPETIRQMFAEIAPRYDTANRILSMRLDNRWRNHLARKLLPRSGRVLDVASGTGDLAIALQRAGHRVIAADFTFEMLAAAKPGLKCVGADALSLPFSDGAFDGAAVGWGIRNFIDPISGLREIRRILVRGGALGILDLSTPSAPLRPFFNFYFDRLVPAIGGAVTGSRGAYCYLNRTVREFPEGKEFLGMMSSAGFEELTINRLSGGVVSFYRGVRR